MSGGRNDASVLCIAHKDGKTIIQDKEVVVPSPHNPNTAIGQFCEVLKRFGINRVTGDAYSAEFVVEAFKSHGIAYRKCDKNKSALYMEMLPLLTSERVELLDSKRLVKQLCGLQRRSRAGAVDSVDHAQGEKDDQANALGGVSYLANAKLLKAGAAGF